MAMEPGFYHDTLFAGIEDLCLEPSSCKDPSFPSQWMSPLTYIWNVESSGQHVEASMLLLAKLMHSWLATFLDENNDHRVPNKDLLEERAALRQKVENFVPMARASNIEAESAYESCRWASLVLLAVEKLGIPIHVAAKIVCIQPRLVKRLRMTDLSDLWGARKGLLLWVVAICNFATAGQCFPILCGTLLARFTQVIAMSNYCSEIAIEPMRRLKQFESLCYCPERTSQVTGTLPQLPTQNLR
jgi:hypothetical protein